tara:strand:+ start:13 stop:585 length:573 start_codon:yes stop_codon:yes gene_type:complete
MITIRSRLQAKKFKKINTSTLVKHFQNKFPKVDLDFINFCVTKNHHNYIKIFREISGNIDTTKAEDLFVIWVRLCFLSTSKKNIFELLELCNKVSLDERAFQVYFTEFVFETFRSAFFLNYNLPFAKGYDLKRNDFDLNKLSKHVNSNNIFEICNLLNQCHACLKNRTSPNSKILFLDLSLTLGSLLHKN